MSGLAAFPGHAHALAHAGHSPGRCGPDIGPVELGALGPDLVDHPELAFIGTYLVFNTLAFCISVLIKLAP